MPTNNTSGYTNDNDDQERAAQRQGQQPNTGYVNFETYFSGNQDAAKRGAQQLANQTQGSVNSFQQNLTNTEGQFTQDSIKHAPKAPPTVTPTGSTNVGTAANSSNVPGANTSNDISAAVNATAPQNALQGALTADAGDYGGPAGLSNESSYQNTANAAQTAQEYLDSLTNTGQTGVDASGNPTGNLQALVQAQNPNEGNGAGLLSTALEGAAGSQQFEALRNANHPEQALAKAETDSENYFNHENDLQHQYEASVQQALDNLNNPGSAHGASAVSADQQTIDNFKNNPQSSNPPDLDKLIDADSGSGMSPDQLVAKYGYAAYDNYVNEQFSRH